MNKAKFLGFIERYHLGGEIETVNLVSDGSTLSVDFISTDTVMIGNVNVSEMNFPEGTFGIFTTSQLKQFLSVLGDAFQVEVEDDLALRFSDENKTQVRYILAASSVVRDVPSLTNVPDYEVSVKLDPETRSRLIKAIRAAADDNLFTFVYKNGQGSLILGYSSKNNTNQISIDVDCSCSVGAVKPISFSAKYLQHILNVNTSTVDANMLISSAGLCSISFSGEEFETQYYLSETE